VYAIQNLFHIGLMRGMKFLTLANVDVCENAWYIIHRVLRFVYHVYKLLVGGCVSGWHGNAGTI